MLLESNLSKHLDYYNLIYIQQAKLIKLINYGEINHLSR